MESFHNDTPLGDYLLHGEGQHDNLANTPQESTGSPVAKPAFAPRLARDIRLRLRTSSLSKLHFRRPSNLFLAEAPRTWWHAITTQVGFAENAHFLEHFRYLVIASQLLEESPDFSLLSGSRTVTPKEGDRAKKLTPLGAGVAATIAFLLVWLLNWIRRSGITLYNTSATVTFTPIAVGVLHVVVRRHFMRHLQDRALRASTNLISVLQAFESTSNSAFSAIQEVELVAKGYKVSPLPPISRIDDARTLRRCLPLRRRLFNVNVELIEAYIVAHRELQRHCNLEDYEKFIDIYDVPKDGIQEAIGSILPADVDKESLGVLRMLGYRHACLRRAILCSLLSMGTTNDSASKTRWRRASRVMDTLTEAVAKQLDALRESMKELVEFLPETSPRPQPRHHNEKLRAQVRKISNLSAGIRSLQAKMMLLREESNSALLKADDVTDLGPSLLSQYDTIGADIQALLQDWETGKKALTTNVQKTERRISHASSGAPQSPSTSFSGINAVTEGGPAEALRALNGEPRSEVSFSPRSSMPTTPSDEEVFEAFALPRPQSMLTRAERIQLMHEERARAEERKEMRESGINMMKELKSVMNVRKRGLLHPDGTRITSF